MTNAQPEPKLTHIVIEAVSRQWRLFFAAFVGVVIFTILVILFVPKHYEASAQLIIENLRTRSSLSTQPVDKVVMSDDVTESQINSEDELLHSQVVLRRALNMPPVTSDTPVSQMASQQKDLDRLMARLEIAPVRQSSIINVKLTDNSPQGALDKLNGVLNAYFEERAKLTQSSGAVEFFEKQTEDFGQRLDESRKKLSDFEIAHELVDMNDQKKIVVSRIATLDDHINDARAKLAGQGARTRELDKKLQTTPARSETTRRSLTNQYAQEHLNTALVDMENRRTELLHRYPPTDRAVVELDEKITTTKKAIDEASNTPASENATDVNPIWAQVSSLLLSANVEIVGTKAEQDELLAEKNEAQRRLHELLQATGTYDDLSRNYNELQTNFNLYAQKRDEAKISEALDSQKMFNVSLVQRPVALSTPTRPKPIPYLAAGIAAGLFLGLLLAVYADRSAERIYTPQQLDAATKMQTLASIPEEGAEIHGDSSVASGRSLLEYRKLLAGLRSSFGRPMPASTSFGATPGSVTGSLHENPTGSSPLLSIMGEGRGRCIAFTSTTDGEGVSTIVSHLATEAAGQARQRAALLDMYVLNAMAGHGATARVMLRRDPKTLVWMVDTNNGQFYASDPSSEDGPPPAPNGELIDLGDLHGDRFWVGLDKVLARAREEFTLTLLDCPSLRGSSLALELDGDVDGYVVVVRAGTARQRQVEQVASLMQQASAPLIGYVLNRRTYPVPGWLYDMFW
jgi:uncharacterized protein involved in exopolysaccharide biosynthesis/Mrp family chromosome partitioning ATPase